ncbi:MAG: NAD(P)-dependent oxidoreductase [Alphaproteobacteria bacterium]|nr:NAD(P)-dependent oxidoreductase [Alphaproteobacteria bacterium]
MARVLITGGGGFLGSHLARHCLARGDQVHLAVRASTNLDRVSSFFDRLTIHVVDLSDRHDVDELLGDVQPHEIYHLAVPTRPLDLPAAEEGLRRITGDLMVLANLVAAADASQRPPEVLVRAGSMAEYGPIPTPYRETDREQPLNLYSAILAAGTHYLSALQGRLRFRAVTARLALVYGADQNDDFFIPTVLRKLSAGEKITIRRPDDRRDLLFIDDAIKGLMALARRAPAHVCVVNVGSGVSTSMFDVARLIREYVGAPPTLVDVRCEAIERDGSVGIADLRGSTELCTKLIGWTAKYDLETGLRRLIGAGASRLETAGCNGADR